MKLFLKFSTDLCYEHMVLIGINQNRCKKTACYFDDWTALWSELCKSWLSWVLLGFIGAQHWVRVGSGSEKFNPDPGWVGFWVETLDPSWVMRKPRHSITMKLHLGNSVWSWVGWITPSGIFGNSERYFVFAKKEQDILSTFKCTVRLCAYSEKWACFYL
jgi:hypothetical protein